MMSSSRRMFIALSAAMAAPGSAASIARPCPLPTPGLRTEWAPNAGLVELYFLSDMPFNLEMKVLDGLGNEDSIGILQRSPGVNRSAYAGQAFRIYGSVAKQRVLMHEHVARDGDTLVQIWPCGPVEDRIRAGHDGYPMLGMRRAEEFTALAHSSIHGIGTRPCEPPGRSDLWSCVRYLPPATCEARHRNEQPAAGHDSFGLPAARGPFPKGTYEATNFDWQMKLLPRMSQGPGFLKMNMTDLIRRNVDWYYNKRLQEGDIPTEAIVRTFLHNDDVSPSDHVNLEDLEAVRDMIVTEMRDVLEWWVGGWTRLKHHATYGIRVYKRGAVLINHVDMHTTHLASAVLQVGQRTDENGGWPLEILTDDRGCYEVYLQPGEMVLYEGARFKHGRPMSFRGDAFANIFTHFSPSGWEGVRQEL
mmetsp:Transcript_32147/g.89552  ORF Transcript_32147/g.89552 Transcript_32147/m.89552 type:complete len:418 (+) Transcript_32147:81-1334(+)